MKGGRTLIFDSDEEYCNDHCCAYPILYQDGDFVVSKGDYVWRVSFEEYSVDLFKIVNGSNVAVFMKQKHNEGGRSLKPIMNLSGEMVKASEFLDYDKDIIFPSSKEKAISKISSFLKLKVFI